MTGNIHNRNVRSYEEKEADSRAWEIPSVMHFRTMGVKQEKHGRSEEAKQYLDDRTGEMRQKKMGIHFTKPLSDFRRSMMYLKMMKKSFAEVFFRSSMNNGRGKTKLFQSKN